MPVRKKSFLVEGFIHALHAYFYIERLIALFPVCIGGQRQNEHANYDLFPAFVKLQRLIFGQKSS
jgi:hypothetical protein